MLSKKNFQFIFTSLFLYSLNRTFVLSRNIDILKRNYSITNNIDTPKDRKPIGFGRNTVGGDVEESTIYNIYNLEEFFKALDNQGHPDDPKIIYVNGKIQGNIKKIITNKKRSISTDFENEESDDLIESIDESIDVEAFIEDSDFEEEIQYMTESDYAPGYSISDYLSCFGEDGKVWENSDECNHLEELRLQGHINQRDAIMLRIGNNTSIYGVDENSRLQDIFLNIKGSDQVIVRHLTVDTPRDFFSEWDPTDGINGSWNAAFTGIAIENSTNVWIDNCHITDGEHSIVEAGKKFGTYIELHDGALDIWRGADYITISNCRFSDHQKTMLIGSSDSMKTDAGKFHITLYNNVFENCKERLPRVRFGKVHIFNNYYYSTTDSSNGYNSLSAGYYNDPKVFANYFIGLGVECDITSQYNYFLYEGTEDIPDSETIVVYSYGGYTFSDVGSLYNGHTFDPEAIANESFEIKKASRIESDALKGKNPPAWTNATFNNKSFNPSEYYDYEVIEDMNVILSLVKRTIPEF
ncbi:pectin lyase-like protein [Piromyces finnis]|uniref:Pectin lyase-like protein n=1 Tax=Piromyces finnis TaxID=1754191 RepID=A0A1Y1V9P0_9FUNG|nr:pectin lyase-like protein [Piromyces finnis]|eukprot:ORX50372.1 pectin lyase-like protein [Piromyces finnis]